MSHALVSSSLKVARRSGEDEQIEARLETYADLLMGWPEPVALAVLNEHPRRSIYWPAWKELEDLRAEHEERQREARAALPASGAPESFAARCQRLGIGGRRLVAIGVQRYRPVMARHLELSDQQVVASLTRLERGRPAFDESDAQVPFTQRRDWDEFAAAMASLRDPSHQHYGRAELLAIGEKIEQRQRPAAEARGWA